ncbi:MAG TPA: hypothetical protein VGH72_33635 [Pseudonocardia sp.]
MAEQWTYQITYLDGKSQGFVNVAAESQTKAIEKFEAKFPARTVSECKLLGKRK